ncbi:MAG: SDR family oxidoreductase [Burkholderiaceae bacterium]|jgi:3-oxoacyl-[acyl-carrier protein] reductase|nr:SDR family oxidoreductase [Burkholderiaceae bacterium]
MNPQRQSVALVTGGAGALGTVTGATLARRGDAVYLLDADGARAEAGAADLARQGLSVQGRALDVTRAGDCDALIAEIAARHDGGIDTLVNMAGVVRNAAFSRIADEDFELTLKTHVSGTMHCMRAAGAAMRNRQYGRIVNISSIAALGSVGGGAYGAAKGAIEALSRAAAIEWAARGITVNCVAPGLIAAGMTLGVPKEFQDAGVARTPMKRHGTAQEVAHAIAFFASPQASFITGQTLFVCGGLSIGF